MYEFELLKKVSVERLQALLEITENILFSIIKHVLMMIGSESKDYCCPITFRRIIIAMHE
jgi:hypothetical protein